MQNAKDRIMVSDRTEQAINVTTTAAKSDVSSKEALVVAGAATGTIFELYDFFLVGALSTEIAANFFSRVNPNLGFILTLMSFAAGFVMRPFGGLVFGRLGDLVGRKQTFLTTMLIMGIATFAIGLLPDYSQIGLFSPILFVFLRMIQGLAIGGEFGGAFIYVAEHSLHNTRGRKMSWVVATGAGGFLLSLIVVMGLRQGLGPALFSDWGWRLPFLLSSVILFISLWIRLKLQESPEFLRMSADGRLSRAPIWETFGQRKNARLLLVALFGVMMGSAVLFYTGQLYTLFFLSKALKIEPAMTNLLIIGATILTSPVYYISGALSDVFGRRRVLLIGCMLGALLTMPLFKMLAHYANPSLERAQLEAPITVSIDPSECAFQFDPTGTAKFTSSCDIVKASLAKAGLSYRSAILARGELARIQIGDDTIQSYRMSEPDSPAKAARFNIELNAAINKYGYGGAGNVNFPAVIAILAVLLSLGAMTFTSSIAMLVEMFPARIRYTAISIPYHLSSALFGGFMPAIAFAVVASTGDPFSGLWYTVAASTISFFVLLLFSRKDYGAEPL